MTEQWYRTEGDSRSVVLKEHQERQGGILVIGWEFVREWWVIQVGEGYRREGTGDP